MNTRSLWRHLKEYKDFYTSAIISTMTTGAISAATTWVYYFAENECFEKLSPIIDLLDASFKIPPITIKLNNLPIINETIQIPHTPYRFSFRINLNQYIPNITTPVIKLDLDKLLPDNIIQAIEELPDQAKVICGGEMALHGAAYAAIAGGLTGLLSYAYLNNRRNQKAFKALQNDVNNSRPQSPAFNLLIEDEQSSSPSLHQ